MSTGDDSALVRDDANLSVAFAYLLWALFAVHRIYLGRPVSGALQLVTLAVALVLAVSDIWGGGAIGTAALVSWILWFVVDAFRIPGMVSKYNSTPSQEQ